MDKKQKILLVLALLFAISLAYRLMNPYQQQTVSRLTYTSDPGDATNKRDKNKTSEPSILGAEVQLDLFLNPRRHPARMFRNIFEKTAPREFSAAMPTATTPLRQPQDSMEPIGRQEQQQSIMKQDLDRFTVFGSYESGGQKFIFLERQKDVLIVQDGDTIDGKYRVERISDQSLVIRSRTEGISVVIDISSLDAL